MGQRPHLRMFTQHRDTPTYPGLRWTVEASVDSAVPHEMGRSHASSAVPTNGGIRSRRLICLVALWVAQSANASAHDAADLQGGAALYRRHCASCHGIEGGGDGPAAPALSPPPTNLTRLQSSVSELMRDIDGTREVRAHGSSAMPVWGEVFSQSLLGKPYQRRTALLHVQALADYVSRLRKPARSKHD